MKRRAAAAPPPSPPPSRAVFRLPSWLHSGRPLKAAAYSRIVRRVDSLEGAVQLVGRPQDPQRGHRHRHVSHPVCADLLRVANA